MIDNSKQPKPAKASKPTKAQADAKLATVVMRNDFYRDGYRTLMKMTIGQTLIILLLVLAMFYVVSIHQPEDRYFATTEDGRVIPMVALNQPNLSNAALSSWVAQASTDIMTFGHNDYRRQLQEASSYFTRQGWQSFTKALEEASTIETVTANKQIISAAPRGAPIILGQGVVNGRFQWRVQFPLSLTYESGSKKSSRNYVVTATVVRVSRLESPNGIGFDSWIAQ